MRIFETLHRFDTADIHRGKINFGSGSSNMWTFKLKNAITTTNPIEFQNTISKKPTLEKRIFTFLKFPSLHGAAAALASSTKGLLIHPTTLASLHMLLASTAAMMFTVVGFLLLADGVNWYAVWAAWALGTVVTLKLSRKIQSRIEWKIQNQIEPCSWPEYSRQQPFSTSGKPLLNISALLAGAFLGLRLCAVVFPFVTDGKTSEFRIQKAVRKGSVFQVLCESTLAASPDARKIALNEAAARGRLNILETLTVTGASTSELNQALYSAAYAGQPEAVQCLLDNGAELVAPGDMPDHPLFPAVLSKNPQVVQVLLRNGADVNVKTFGDRTPLLFAVRDGNETIVKALLEAGADPNAANENQDRPLLNAVELNQVEIVKMLLAKGADPNAVNRNGDSMTDIAARNGFSEVALLLLDKNSETATRLHALSSAISNNRHTTAIRIAESADEIRLLTAAATSGQNQVVGFLLNQGVGPDVIDSEGSTPLISAVQAAQFDSARVLLRRGANPDFKDDQGSTALATAALLGNSEMVGLLLKHGANIDSRTDYGSTPLMSAVQGQSPEVINLLLQQGANVNLKDDDGSTPLMWAAMGGNPEIVKLLLKHGAAVNAKDANGSTAINYAEEYPKIIRILKHAGGRYGKPVEYG